MHAIAAMVVMSVLFPTKMWFSPDQPLMVQIKSGGEVVLVLTDFLGKPIAAQADAKVSGEQTVDVRKVFPTLAVPGTYVLFATEEGGRANQFVGTPLVISVREDKRHSAPLGAMVIKVEPLRYAVMETEHGPVTIAFYYDVAPNTAANFLTLAANGFYDGLTFHKVIPGYVIQGGDPRGDGTGGPGYHVDAEFNDRPHLPGVLSMARGEDPNEAAGGIPRSDYANSAGSQFFICLDYDSTKALDHKYTAFAKVIDGMNAVTEIAKAPLADVRLGKPEKAQLIQKVQIFSVTPEKNPYREMMTVKQPTALPAGEMSTQPVQKSETPQPNGTK